MAFFLSTAPRETPPAPPRPVTPLDSLAEFEVHPPTLRRRVVQTVGQPLFLVALVVSLLYAALAFSHLWSLPRPAGLMLARVAAVLASVCFLMAAALASWPSLRRAMQPMVSLLGILVLGHALAQIHLLGEIKYSLTLLPLLFGLACFLVSRLWFGLQTVLTLTAWAATVAWSCAEPDWLLYGGTLFITTLLATLIHVVRVAGSTRLEKMRLRDTERKADLEAVRQALQKERYERRTADEAQRAEAARVRLLAEGSPDLVAEHAAQGEYLFISDVSRALLGKDPQEMLGRLPWEFVHSEDVLIMQEAFLHVRSQKQPRMVRYRLAPPFGPARIVETSLRPVRDPASGEVVSLTSMTRDLTQQREHATARYLHEEQLKRVLTHAPLAIVALDRQGIITLCDGLAREAFGLPEAALGKSIFDLSAQPAAWLQQLRKALTGESVQTECQVGEHPFAVQFAPLREEDGTLVGTMAIARSLRDERQKQLLETTLKQKDDECRRLAASLEDAEAELAQEQQERQQLENNLETANEACQAATDRARQLETTLRETSAVVEQLKAEQQGMRGAVEEAEHAFVQAETLRRSLWEVLPLTIFQMDENGLYREYRVAGEKPLLLTPLPERQPIPARNTAPAVTEPQPTDSALAFAACVGQPYQRLGPPTWIKLLHEARTAAQKTGAISTFSYVSPAEHGPEQHYDVRVFAQKNGYCLGIIRNVTAQRNAERQWQELRQAHEETQVKTDALDKKCAALGAAAAMQAAVWGCVSEVALIATDAQGRITAFGHGAEQLLGYATEEVLGEPATLVLDAIELAARGQELSLTKSRPLNGWEALTAVAKREGHEKRTWTLVTKDDRKRKAQVIVTALPVSDTERGGYLLAATDSSIQEELETAVLELEANHEAAVQASLEAIITFDGEGRIQEFNPVAERLFGMKRVDARKTKITDWLIPQDQREEFERSLKYFLATNDSTTLSRAVEMTAQRADGSSIPIEMTIHAEKREGQPPRFTAHVRDLTERRQLAVAQAEQAQIIALSTEVGSYLLGKLPLRDAMQQCAQAMVRPFPGAFVRLRLLNQPEGMLEVQASAGASPELLLTQAALGPQVLDRVGQEKKPLIASDVVAEPWLEKTAEQKLEGVQGCYGCPLLSQDRLLGTLVFFAPRPLPAYANDLLQSLAQQMALGIARHEGPGQQPVTVVDTAALEEQVHAQAALRQEVEDQRTHIKTLEDQLRQLKEAPKPKESSRKKLEAERQEFEAKLKEAQQGAAAADKARGEFLTTMSQEIRSPLTGILGQTDILLDPHLDTADRLKALQGIKRGGEQLLHVMNDLLDLSRIETGQLQLDRSPCSPWQLVQEVLLSLQTAAQDKGVLLSVVPSGPLPREITTDPTRLRQIVHHLLRHALHTTPRGQVTVRLGVPSVEEGQETRLLIAVEDESGGFTADELDRLFSPLPIFDTAFLRKVGGSGLALSLSRRLARSLGGDLKAQSQIGQGNCFTLELPVAPDELNEVQTTEELTLKTTLFRPLQLPDVKTKLKGRSLLVERNKDNQRVMAYFLERLGLSTELAPNAETALEWLAEEDFQLILIDMDQPVPELDGPQLARLFREKGYKQPLLGLLSYTLKGEEQTALDAGCDGILYKPVEQDPWQATLSRFLQAAPSTEVSPQPPAPQEPPIISTYRDDADFMHLVRDYAGSLTGRLAELRAALKVGDLARFIKLSHLLKGSAATYGYPILSVIAGEMEKAACSGLDGPRLNDMLDALTNTAERVRQAFVEEAVSVR